MTALKEIVNVTITKQTKGVSERGFGLVNIIGPNLTKRYGLYGSAAELVADLTNGDTDPEYQAAVDIFGLANPPIQITVSQKDVGDADYGAALNAVLAEFSDFYGVVCAVRTLADQKDVADWVQANERVAIFASDSDELIGVSPSADNIAKHVQDNSMNRCMVVYSAAASTRFLDAALLALYLGKAAGSYNPAHQEVAGLPSDGLSTGKSSAAHTLLVTTYEEISGVNDTLFGWVGDGDYFDITHYVDWLKARLAEYVFRGLHINDKLPHQSEGYAVTQDNMNEVFSVAKENGGTGPNEFDANDIQTRGYSITMPTRATVPTNDVANRELNNVKFTNWYESPYGKVQINGILTL